MPDLKENPWLYPQLIHSAEGLHLFARQALTTFMSGVHGSRRVGAEQEFSQYRSYQPGDDLRRLDWKVYARSGRLYVREAEVQSRLFIRFVLDASASMLHQHGRWNKFNYARALIALFAFIARRQQDDFALFAANEQLNVQQLPGSDKGYIHRFFHVLSQLEAGGYWPEPDKVPYFPAHPQKNELTVVFTDMYQEKEEWYESIGRLQQAKNEVMIIHLMAGNELKAEQWTEAVSLQDLESGEVLHLQTSGDRRKSAESIDSFLREMKAFFTEKGISSVLVNTEEEPHEAISLFLKKRLMMQ